MLKSFPEDVIVWQIIQWLLCLMGDFNKKPDVVTLNITEKEFEKIICDNESRVRHLCRIYANHEGEEKDLFQKSLFRYGDLSLCLTAMPQRKLGSNKPQSTASHC